MQVCRVSHILCGAQIIQVKKQAFTAQPVPEVVARQRELEKKAAEALRYHNSPAGTRGASSRILFPVADAVVWPERFVIRWRALTHPGKIALSVYAPNSTQPLWEVREVDGTAGSLDGADLKRAILNYRDTAPKDAILTLEWRTPSSGLNVPFSVLSLEDEKKLKDELEVWNQTNNLLRAIGRAYSFASRNLLWEAAQEYEEALNIAPGSCDLLDEARAAEEQVNNWTRVEELKRDLEADHCVDRDR